MEAATEGGGLGEVRGGGMKGRGRVTEGGRGGVCVEGSTERREGCIVSYDQWKLFKERLRCVRSQSKVFVNTSYCLGGGGAVKQKYTKWGVKRFFVRNFMPGFVPRFRRYYGPKAGTPLPPRVLQRGRPFRVGSALRKGVLSIRDTPPVISYTVVCAPLPVLYFKLT